MTISTTHPEYIAYSKKWSEVKKVIKNDAKIFIKPIDEDDEVRTARYRDDAILTNFTARTKNGLVGAVFRKNPRCELPTQLEYLIDDATPEGWKLDQLAQACLTDTLEIGRLGLLIDYPQRDYAATIQQVADENIHARICRYSAESIINWNTERLNGKVILSLVVLCEDSYILQDDFTWTKSKIYRVLRLINGIYVQQIYDQDNKFVEEYQPLRGDGNPWTEIPFVFIGSENNDSTVDQPPLYDLATLNIGHYRNSADIEEMARLIGQPMLVISSDYSQEQFTESLGGKALIVGARRGVFLGQNGSATYAQPNESQIGDTLMKRKEEQAVMLGARLITPSGGIETAEAARMRYGSENSILNTIVKNVSDGIEYAIYYVAIFENILDVERNPELVSYKLNDQFFENNLDPIAISAAIQLFDRGIISNVDLYSASKRAGLVESEKSFEDTLNEIDEESPLVGTMQPTESINQNVAGAVTNA